MHPTNVDKVPLASLLWAAMPENPLTVYPLRGMVAKACHYLRWNIEMTRFSQQLVSSRRASDEFVSLPLLLLSPLLAAVLLTSYETLPRSSLLDHETSLAYTFCAPLQCQDSKSCRTLLWPFFGVSQRVDQ